MPIDNPKNRVYNITMKTKQQQAQTEDQGFITVERVLRGHKEFQ